MRSFALQWNIFYCYPTGALIYKNSNWMFSNFPQLFIAYCCLVMLGILYLLLNEIVTSSLNLIEKTKTLFFFTESSMSLPVFLLNPKKPLGSWLFNNLCEVFFFLNPNFTSRLNTIHENNRTVFHFCWFYVIHFIFEIHNSVLEPCELM